MSTVGTAWRDTSLSGDVKSGPNTIQGNPPGSPVWANFPIFILSNIWASHRCHKSWKMIGLNRSIFPIFGTSKTNTSVRQDESGKRNHER